MIPTAIQTVHTTGVNWGSVIAIVASTTVIITFIVGAFTKILSNSVTSAINKFRIDVVSSLDKRLTEVETILRNTARDANRRHGGLLW